MDPNNQNPQGENDAVKKLEQDLQNIKKQEVAAKPTVPEVQPVQPATQIPEVPSVVPAQPTPQDAPGVSSDFMPDSTKKGSPILIVAIILAVVAVLAVVAYVFGAKLLSPQPTSIPLAVSTPTPVADLTASWKAYTSSDGKFSFKYPNDWGTLDLGGPFMVAPLTNIEMISKTKNQPNYGISSGKQSVLVVETITGVDNSIENNTVVSNQYWSVVKSTLNVGNVVAAKYLSTCVKDTPNGYVKGDITLQVNIPSGNSALIELSLGDQMYSQIFDQILSTFKFIEATPTPSLTASPTASPTSSPSATITP